MEHYILKIINSSSNEEDQYVINNIEGNLYLQENVTLKFTNDGLGGFSPNNRVVVDNESNLYLQGATIIVDHSSLENADIGINNCYSGVTNITSGVINVDPTVDGIAVWMENRANSTTSVVNISGGTINGPVEAANGTLNITDDAIINGPVRIYSTLNLGTNDGTVDITTPKLTDGLIIESGGTFNFYDGYVQDDDNTPIDGTVSSTAPGYSVTKEAVTGGYKEYLVANYFNITTETGYGTLSAALSAAQSNQIIRVQGNTTETASAKSRRFSFKKVTASCRTV